MEPDRQSGPGPCIEQRGWHVGMSDAGSEGAVDRDDHGLRVRLDDDLLRLERAAREREDAFEAFYREVLPGLRSYVATRTRFDAEDVLAEVFVVVWRRWADLPPERDERRAWTYGIARNALRGAARSRLRSVRLAFRIGTTAVEVRQHGGADEVDAREAAEHLLSRLPAGEAAVMRLTVLEGFPPAEAAQRLGLSVSAVTSAAHRARRRLQGLAVSEEVGR